jgi:xylulokinase
VLLGLDLGTGSLKALLLAPSGAVLAEASASYEVASPQPGWAETDPEAWWRATVTAVRTALNTANGAAPVTAIALSGQMHGVVLVDVAGTPLRPAVLWADTRAAPLLGRYRELLGELCAALENPITAGMAGPTLLWLQRHEPQLVARARWALQPKDWLRLRLTGEVAAEPSDASGTLLYAPREDAWLVGAAERLGLEPSLLPPLVPSRAVVGTLRPKAAAALGLPAGVRVVAGGADTACAALGSGLVRAGEAQLTVGTGAQLIVVQEVAVGGSARGVHLYRTVLGPPHAPFYTLGAVQNAGLALEWARRTLGASWEAFYALAFSVPPGSGGVTFLPYLSGERTPHLDAEVRGGWVGLSLHSTPAQLARAALEGVAFALRDALEALELPPEVPLKLAGGGTAQPAWRQLLADTLRRPLVPSATPAASARGAALLAGLGVGVYDGVEALPPPGAAGEVVTPTPPDARREAAYARFRTLYPRLRGWPESAP